jgi:hypothetical protein
MQLELTSEEATVLNVAAERIQKDKELAETIFAGDKEDARVFSGVAAKIRDLSMRAKGKF